MNAQKLKLIAVITMLVDHLGYMLNILVRYQMAGENFAHYMTGDFYWMRMIGRVAFPLFAFLIAEGCAHTRNLPRYMGRLLLFAGISQLPFQVFNNLSYGTGQLLRYTHCNVLVTLLAGAFAVFCYRQAWEQKRYVGILGVLAAYAGVLLLRGEYDILGVSIILAVYIFRPKKEEDADIKVPGSRVAQAVLCGGLTLFYYGVLLGGVMEGLFAAVSAVLLLFYNGRPGNRRGKWAFYLFYPVHISIIATVMYCYMKG